MSLKKGFVIIIVIASLAVIFIIAWAVVNIGCGEILETRMRNDLISAYYIAVAGAENMYATLDTQNIPSWPVSLPQTYISQDGSNVGCFTASADTIPNNKFCIVSNGTVNGRTAKVVVRYGYDADFTGGVPLGSIGQMSLIGVANPSKLKIEGPVMSNQSTITTEGFVEVNEGILPNQNFLIPTFWCDADLNPKIKFDVNNDTNYAVDMNEDGVVTSEEAQAQEKEGFFLEDDVYPPAHDSVPKGDGVINDKDAFFRYYTYDLNGRYNLGIAPGEANYRSGTSSFDDDTRSSIETVASNVRVIFVDGDVNIDKNDQNWQGDVALNHTIAATGNISITQPTNREGDVSTIVSYGNVSISGTTGEQGGAVGDLVIYADGNFTATGGGKTNSSIFTKGDITVNTEGTTGRYHRLLNRSTINWTDPSNRPIGLPKDYAIISPRFSIRGESVKPSIWQRN